MKTECDLANCVSDEARGTFKPRNTPASFQKEDPTYCLFNGFYELRRYAMTAPLSPPDLVRVAESLSGLQTLL